jgi:quercetin dioxygenase-like cupin family protein
MEGQNERSGLDRPLRHRVESLRPAATEIVVIEFKSLPPAARKVATSPSAPVYENELIKVTHGKLGPKEKGPVHTHPMYIGVFLTAANLRATLADGTVREITGKRGDASWRAPVTHSIENLADTPFEAIDVNFKTVRGGR